MIVRNVVSQGYPYIEAIRSALPLCHEFLVADGFSEDETWEGLECLRSQFPHKIRLFRESWEGSRYNGEILADMSNRLLEKCSGNLCFNLQANEVIPSESLEEIAKVPGLFPKVTLFRLPFLSIMGRDLAWMVDSRGRLFRKIPGITSLGDAYDVGFAGGTKKGIGTKRVELSLPVHRYRALYPVNYIRKLESRLTLFLSEHAQYYTRKELEYAKSVLTGFNQARDRPDQFWERMRSYFEKEMWENNPSPLDPGTNIPRQMQGFHQTASTLATTLPDRWEYKLSDSLELLSIGS